MQNMAMNANLSPALSNKPSGKPTTVFIGAAFKLRSEIGFNQFNDPVAYIQFNL